ncbi:MAG: acetyl-CoA carboxylase biotin carboxyl carrier protein [Candidatus Eisenbacteria sp.]|nr:acetyl-CoA carboxylase biotin carboxyl carrier protein [Candidatus Eisenbacteria bacterium]
MRVEEIKRLIELVEHSQIDELEVRRWWSTVRISKARRRNGHTMAEAVAPRSEVTHSPQMVKPQGPTPTCPEATDKKEPDEELVAIVSPMVGTFYRSPSPTSPAYVETGKRVAVGQVVCIIEAMKLMNEIESEVSGTIVKIQAENEQPVEFNQPLFMVRPDS